MTRRDDGRSPIARTAWAGTCSCLRAEQIVAIDDSS